VVGGEYVTCGTGGTMAGREPARKVRADSPLEHPGCRHRAAEPVVPTVLVQWLRSTSNAASEGGCHIGDRRYQGRAGERVEIPAADAQVLMAARFVVPATHQTAARTT